MFDEIGFMRDGFTIVRSAIEEEEVDRFLHQAVRPTIQDFCGVDIFGDASTFPVRDGDAIRGRSGGGNEDHPITSSEEKRWPALFSSETLLSALDHLHGDSRENWEWDAGAVDGVGWIHIRWPIQTGPWIPPYRGWHLDAGTTNLICQQSVICLPIVTPLRGGCGGTALLRGSHLAIARAMHDACGAITYERLIDYINGYLMPAILRIDPNAIQEARGEPGDILILHPLLYHACSNACLGAPVRITFNLSVKHRRAPFLSTQECCLVERAIISALQSGKDSPNTFGGNLIRYGEPIFMRFCAHGGIIGLQSENLRVFLPGLQPTNTDTRHCAFIFSPVFDNSRQGDDDDNLTMITTEDDETTQKNPQKLTQQQIGDIVHCGDIVTIQAFYDNTYIEVQSPQQAGDWAFATAAVNQTMSCHFEIYGLATLPLRYGDTIALRALTANSFLHADPSWTDGGRLGAQFDHPRGQWQQISILRFLRPESFLSVVST
uniref:Uncharacterized protein n=1 Tax=Aureoumbra lagunensis TaxID=44058 RepID=A0A7S3NK00_9STRA